MNAFLDDTLVAALLLASVFYALWALGPRVLRARMLETLGATFERGPRVLGCRALARRFQAAAAKKQAACGGCDGCEPAPGQASGGAEIKIPVSKIGRRS
jgi:hypothetical protein